MDITDPKFIQECKNNARARLMDLTFGYDSVGHMMMDIRSSGLELLPGDLEALMRGERPRVVLPQSEFKATYGRAPRHQYEAAEYYLALEGEPDDDAPMAKEEEADEVDAITEAVAGNHYNDVIPGYQYMELMQHMLEGREGVNAHLMGQTYKYLMRAGKKDDETQELRKARWYITCLIKLLETGEIDVHNNDQ